MQVAAACIVGMLLDFALGERASAICPAVLFGKLIAALERVLRKVFPATKGGERVAGTFLALIVCIVAFCVPLAILVLLWHLWWPLPVALSALWFYQIIATRGLADAGKGVYKALKEGTIEDARYAVSMIVGRDTAQLDEAGVTRAAVETIAENASDGCIAPLFWFLVGGAPASMLYKAINTMDSMIAYRNDKYRYFGTCAAILDDVANYIPARLSALFLVASAAILHCSTGRAFKAWRRDHAKSPSPNSAHCESAVAGALGVQLLGPMYYFGELHEKEFIGDAVRPITPEDILITNKLMYGAVIISCIVLCAIRVAVFAALGVV